MTFYEYCQQDNVEGMGEVTRESQKAHIEKIKALIEKITEYRNYNIGKFESTRLSDDDLDVIERALACHMCVIALDMKRGESANQPQAQPIARTPEEIAYYKCCKACGLNARCERENQRDCDEFLEMIDWLTGKQV